MKISVIGAGNVGSLTAMRIAEETSLNITLVDIAKGLAKGKGFDLEDAGAVLKNNYTVSGTEEIAEIKNSDIIVVTAGLTRKPGMQREELLVKNAAIVKDVSLKIKTLSPQAIVIIVTNPLDLMTQLALKTTGFKPGKVFGMGITLDAARFTNLISKELNIPATEIEAVVIGSHGEGMLPLPRFSKIKGINLDEFLDEEKINSLAAKTLTRGAEIVSLIGSGSAYFAPSAAVAEITRVIAKDQKRILGLSAYLNGQYGIKDTCIGVPCRLGKGGIEQIIELDLNNEEKEALLKSASSLKEQFQRLGI